MAGTSIREKKPAISPLGNPHVSILEGILGSTIKLPRKVLILVAEDWYFWSHRLPLAKTLNKNGCSVVIATHVTNHGERILSCGFRLYPLDLKRNSLSPLSELKTVRQIFRIYKEEKPDLVHHVALKPVLYGSLAAKLAGITHVVNALTGLGFIFIKQGLKASVVRSIFSFLYKLAFLPPGSRVIFQNQEDREYFIRKKLASNNQTVLIKGSGVDTSHFYPSPKSPALTSTPVKIVLISRMLWDKGIGELVEAANILKSQDINCDVVLAGKPDPENPAAIPAEVLQKWHSKKIITWLGFVENTAGLLQQSHIAVLPSYREGVPKSLLEAASCGLPLVATDVPGCRDIVRDGVNGMLVPPGNAEKLAQALTSLVKDSSLRERMGKESRQIVEREFSEEIIMQQTLSLYENMVKTKTG